MDKTIFLYEEYIKYLENFIISFSNYHSSYDIKKDFAIDFCFRNPDFAEYLHTKF